MAVWDKMVRDIQKKVLPASARIFEFELEAGRETLGDRVIAAIPAPAHAAARPLEREMKHEDLTSASIRFAALCILALVVLLPSSSRAEAPVFAITPIESSIKFNVEASVAIRGTFDKWDATLTFSSPDVTTGVLVVTIQAASVDTGSGMKNAKLKSKDFFDVKQNPLITFRSTKIVQNGPDTFEVDGNFTIRGVSKPEKLAFVVSGKGTGSGKINGTMTFDRRDYGMNSGIPFIKIADRVEVTLALKGKRVSGPPLVFKQ